MPPKGNTKVQAKSNGKGETGQETLQRGPPRRNSAKWPESGRNSKLDFRTLGIEAACPRTSPGGDEGGSELYQYDFSIFVYL